MSKQVTIEAMKVTFADFEGERSYVLDLSGQDLKEVNLDALSSEEMVPTFKAMLLAGDGEDYSGELRGKLIEACKKILEQQKANGTRPKGKTYKLISQMTNIPQSYVKRYLHPTKVTKESEILRTARTMKYLARDLSEMELDPYSPETEKLKGQADELEKILQKKLKKQETMMVVRDVSSRYVATNRRSN